MTKLINAPEQFDMKHPTQLKVLDPDPDALHKAMRDFLVAKIATGRADSTIEFYRYVLARFAEYASWPPASGQMKTFLLVLRREGKSEATLASYWRGLRAFFNWCIWQGLLSESPLSKLDKPPDPDPIPRAIPLPVLGDLFSAMAERAATGDLVATRDLALFRCMLDCMLRCSEASRLRVSDVDLERRALMILQSKGGKSREGFYGVRADLALRRWMKILHPGSEWLFVSTNVSRGLRPLTRMGIYQAWRRWCKAIGVSGYRVHDLRHSGVIYALRQGINPREVSDQAGHANVAFTLRVYGKASDEDRRLTFQEKAPGDLV
jgi:integrase